MNHQFYMIYGEGCNAPTVKHATRQDANKEAARLAKTYPGTTFYVLKAVQKTQATGISEQELQPIVHNYGNTASLPNCF